MSKKGVPIKAETRERIRQGQLARWERIRAQLAQAEIHEKHCEDEHLTNTVHPRCNHEHENNDKSLWAELKSWLGGEQ